MNMFAYGGRLCSKICSCTNRHGRAIQTSRRGLLLANLWTNALEDIDAKVFAKDELGSKTTQHMRLKANQKDFVIDVLGASTTKREAKSYLNRFQSETKRLEFKQRDQHPRIPACNNVNLGNLYKPTIHRESPDLLSENLTISVPRHVAIVLIRSPDTLSDEVLRGVTRTLSQLSQLGMHCIVILDLRDYLSISERKFTRDVSRDQQEAERRHAMLAQADRFADVLESHLNQRARRVDYLFKVDQDLADLPDVHRGRVVPHFENLHLLDECLDSGAIPVVVPIVRTKDLQLRPIQTQQAVVALSRALAGTANFHPGQKTIEEQVLLSRPSNYSVDRIIVLDSAGGIPAGPSYRKAHVFINLEQEYDDVKRELDNLYNIDSTVAGRDVYPISATAGRHMINLSLVRRALKFLPRSASALITSPEAVAQHEYSSARSETPDVGTRPQRNILIHNILTDKPIRSSSLPPSRLANISDESLTNGTKLSATFLKHGMPVTIIPEPKSQAWKPPTSDIQMLSLQDPRLDIGRLVHLIEDSFGRPLDQKHYFSRIAPSIAGIIIAGAYEGGAILTWEQPPSAITDNLPRFVPYLDKFAVLKRSQGAGGVADIVFSAMVRDCFPQGVCWRSRSDNPVNKWYFERAKGTCRLSPRDGEEPSAQSWTMFWTTEGIQGQRYHDYEEVCRSIGSSWADGKQKLD